MNGRIASVNVSDGGVPKRPIPSAWVGWLGLDGDAHAEPEPIHGGPDQAVCLHSTEAIARVVADGHRAFPGAFGENLTLEGMELDELSAGDRLDIGKVGLALGDRATVEGVRALAEKGPRAWAPPRDE